MWAIIDSRTPKQAIENLKKNFDVLEFKSKGITYEEISGHPDIFIFQNDNELIIAPNSPQQLIDFLNTRKISFSFGEKEVGKYLSNSTQYNCITTDKYLFHKKGFTDNMITSRLKLNKLVELSQAYTRCSLTKLNNNSFITSDKGIVKSLSKENFNILYVSPKDILLPDYPYGFFGGTNGIHNKTLYLIGSLKHFSDGVKVKQFTELQNIQITELYDGPLYDGGGIFFGDNHN